MRTRNSMYLFMFGLLVVCLGLTSGVLGGQQMVLRPTGLTDPDITLIKGKRMSTTKRFISTHRMSDQSPVDTLTWRTLPEPEMNFAALTWGDTLAVWFQPLAACTLKEIRIYNMTFVGNMYIDIWSSRYDGHIVTKESTDVNGWIGTHEDGQWIPGDVLGHSPLGEHLWGPFPLTVLEAETETWLTVPTAPLGEPVLSGEPFLVAMEVYLIEGWGIGGELQALLPYHFFKYYAECCGPGGVHGGWFIRSMSLWVEAVVVYYENTRPVISNMDDLNFTYTPGPFTVEAQITDSDFGDPGRAGVASAYLHWNIEGTQDSVAMAGPGEGDVYTGQIPAVSPGDTVFYYVSATDWPGLRSANAPHRFARLEPSHPEADILLVDQFFAGEPYGFYATLLDSLNYRYEYWNVNTLKGIDESVLSWGWNTAILFGYAWRRAPQIPTRDYEGNNWAAFLDGGKNLLYVDDLYYWFNDEPDVPTFSPGDFAYDYFGLVSGLTDASYYWDPVLHGVPGDPVSGDFVDNPIEQTWLPSDYNWVSYTTASEEGVDIFFNDYGDGCGARYDPGSFKTVFLPWMLDQLLEDTGTDTVPKACVYTLMQNILDWFETEQEVAKGDVNRDGQVNVLDVLATVNHILGTVPLSGGPLDRADCNGDGSINVLDALGIVNVILGIIPACPGDGSSFEVSPEAIQFLKSLQPYLSAEDFAHFMALVKAEAQVPAEYNLAQNYPNPFNASTHIRFSIPSIEQRGGSEEQRAGSEEVKGRNLGLGPLCTTLKIYNILGQEVRTLVDETTEAGYYTVRWDGRDENGDDLASGVYFYRLTAGEFSQTRKMVLLR